MNNKIVHDGLIVLPLVVIHSNMMGVIEKMCKLKKRPSIFYSFGPFMVNYSFLLHLKIKYGLIF